MTIFSEKIHQTIDKRKIWIYCLIRFYRYKIFVEKYRYKKGLLNISRNTNNVEAKEWFS